MLARKCCHPVVRQGQLNCCKNFVNIFSASSGFFSMAAWMWWLYLISVPERPTQAKNTKCLINITSFVIIIIHIRWGKGDEVSSESIR